MIFAVPWFSCSAGWLILAKAVPSIPNNQQIEYEPCNYRSIIFSAHWIFAALFHSDDDFSPGVPCSEVPEGFRCLP